jgi:putative oxidoreductase
MMTSLFSFFHRPIAGFFVLRWTVAGLMLLHGVSKLLHGLGPIEGMLVSAGLPSFIAYGVLVGEVVAPLFVLANRFVMPAALVMAFNMLVAVAMVHSAQVSRWARAVDGRWSCRGCTSSGRWQLP